MRHFVVGFAGRVPRYGRVPQDEAPPRLLRTSPASPPPCSVLMCLGAHCAPRFVVGFAGGVARDGGAAQDEAPGLLRTRPASPPPRSVLTCLRARSVRQHDCQLPQGRYSRARGAPGIRPAHCRLRRTGSSLWPGASGRGAAAPAAHPADFASSLLGAHVPRGTLRSSARPQLPPGQYSRARVAPGIRPAHRRLCRSGCSRRRGGSR